MNRISDRVVSATLVLSVLTGIAAFVSVVMPQPVTYGPPNHLGWVCGAGERLDGSAYVLFLCDNETKRPFMMVHVDEDAYEANTHPLGMGWP